MSQRIQILIACLLAFSAPALVFATDAGPKDAGVEMVPTADAGAPAEAPAANEDPVNLIGSAVTAVRSGDWRGAAAFALALMVLGLRKIKKFKFFGGDRRGALLVLGMSFAGALSLSLMGSQPVDWRMFLTAAEVGVMAAGGYTVFKRIIWPKD